MKKIKTLLMAALAIVTISSCSKNKSDITPPPAPEVTKKMMTTTFNGNISFHYSADGKLKQYISEKLWGTYRYELSYEPGKVTIDIYNTVTNQKAEIHVLTLNAKGHISSTAGTLFNSNGSPYKFTVENFLYDDSGKLIEINSPGSFTRKYFYDANGNNNKLEYYDKQNQLEDISYYTFSALPDKFPGHGMMSYDFYSLFLPARSKYLVSNLKGVDVTTNSTSFDENITYELDAQGYVLKGIVDETTPGSIDWNWSNTWDK
ncbi:MAG TPA: hypothetical protein VN451_02270 [Chitinophagaceae bacterium]|nr:hypothetical protein [Chitinophagaceae bacterium]